MTLLKRLSAFVGLVYVLMPMSVLAEISISNQAPVTIGSELVLKSSILDQQIPIKVNLPSNFSLSSSSHTYPVIFILGEHGERFFHAVSGMVKHLADVERMPETLVVAISGDIPNPDIYHNDMFGSQKHKKWQAWGDMTKYHAFLESELFPLLKKRYRANDKRTVIGVSGSSFYPFYNLTRADSLFDDYVFLAASDIIGMGFSPNKTLIDDLVIRFVDDTRHKPFVFFAVASDDFKNDKRYLNNLNELKNRLNHVKESRFTVKVYDNEGHYDALLKTMLNVIELKYPKQVWSARYRDIVAKPGNAMENLDKYYQRLSERYEFAIFPRATRWKSVNQLGFISQHLIDLGRTEEAVEVAKRYTQYQPKSWQAYEILAKAQEANQNISTAIAKAEIALKLADTELNKERLKQYLTQLNKVS